MQFHTYLEEILGSKVKVKVVRTLLRHPNKSYTGRELARQIQGISHMAVFNSLKDITSFNLIKVEFHGKTQLIRLNKRSYLYQALRSAFKYEDATLNNLLKLLKGIFSKQKEIKQAVLFGSIARGEEKLDSDIDLLIITENKEKINRLISNNQKKITERFGNVMSVLALNKKEFKEKENSELIKNIKKEGIWLINNENKKGKS